uniref:uncharacterized protein isoform X1 n=1 Tax=Myxine glutinosa TaxID=7769 RepID=UPI00358F1D57
MPRRKRTRQMEKDGIPALETIEDHAVKEEGEKNKPEKDDKKGQERGEHVVKMVVASHWTLALLGGCISALCLGWMRHPGSFAAESEKENRMVLERLEMQVSFLDKQLSSFLITDSGTGPLWVQGSQGARCRVLFARAMRRANEVQDMAMRRSSGLEVKLLMARTDLRRLEGLLSEVEELDKKAKTLSDRLSKAEREAAKQAGHVLAEGLKAIDAARLAGERAETQATALQGSFVQLEKDLRQKRDREAEQRAEKSKALRLAAAGAEARPRVEKLRENVQELMRWVGELGIRLGVLAEAWDELAKRGVTEKNSHDNREINEEKQKLEAREIKGKEKEDNYLDKREKGHEVLSKSEINKKWFEGKEVRLEETVLKNERKLMEEESSHAKGSDTEGEAEEGDGRAVAFEGEGDTGEAEVGDGRAVAFEGEGGTGDSGEAEVGDGRAVAFEGEVGTGEAEVGDGRAVAFEGEGGTGEAEVGDGRAVAFEGEVGTGEADVGDGRAVAFEGEGGTGEAEVDDGRAVAFEGEGGTGEAEVDEGRAVAFEGEGGTGEAEVDDGRAVAFEGEVGMGEAEVGDGRAVAFEGEVGTGKAEVDDGRAVAFEGEWGMGEAEVGDGRAVAFEGEVGMGEAEVGDGRAVAFEGEVGTGEAEVDDGRAVAFEGEWGTGEAEVGDGRAAAFEGEVGTGEAEVGDGRAVAFEGEVGTGEAEVGDGRAVAFEGEVGMGEAELDDGRAVAFEGEVGTGEAEASGVGPKANEGGVEANWRGEG